MVSTYNTRNECYHAGASKFTDSITAVYRMYPELSLFSAYPLLSAYYLTIYIYRRMWLTTGVYGTFILPKSLSCSYTVSRSNSTLCCGQIPRFWRICCILVLMSCPLIIAVPLVGVYIPTVQKDRWYTQEAGTHVQGYVCIPTGSQRN